MLKPIEDLRPGDIYIVSGLFGKPDEPHQVLSVEDAEHGILVEWEDGVESVIPHGYRVKVADEQPI